MRVLVTGSNGFIGRNFCANLALRKGLEVVRFDLPQTTDDLQQLVPTCDIVFHLAGVNRPQTDDEFKQGNTDLTRFLTDTLTQLGTKIPLVITSSTQAELDNPYGKSKRDAEDIVFDYAKCSGANVYVYRFPNVFGKWCRPNYNSVVATFCSNVANNMPIRIDDSEKNLTLLYIDDIVAEFINVIDGNVKPNSAAHLSVATTYDITLGALAELIHSFNNSRHDITHTENRNDAFVRKLYATFLSYIPPQKLSVSADMKTDDRGYFAELIKSPYFGQVSVSRTKKGITRGNHWHNTKTEKFMVVEGKAVVRFRKLECVEIVELTVSGEKVEVIDIPPGYVHNFENVGDGDLVTVIWAGELFDERLPDTFYLEV